MHRETYRNCTVIYVLSIFLNPHSPEHNSCLMIDCLDLKQRKIKMRSERMVSFLRFSCEISHEDEGIFPSIFLWLVREIRMEGKENFLVNSIPPKILWKSCNPNKPLVLMRPYPPMLQIRSTIQLHYSSDLDLITQLCS